MTIIGVTGVSGQFANLVIDCLLARGVQPEELRASTRTPQKAEHHRERGIQVRYGDFDDPDSLKEAFAGVERLLVISTDKVGERVEQHRHAVEAAKVAGVRHIAYTSIVHMGEREGGNLLAADHRATERIIQESGLPYTFLRNTFYAELMIEPVLQALESGVFISSAGAAKLGAASKRDLAEAAAIVLSEPGHENKIYELTYPRTWDFQELVGLVSRMTGRPFEYRPVSDEEMAEVLKQAGLPEQAVQMALGMNASLRAGDISKTGPDLEQVLGSPVTPLDELVRRMLPA